MATFAQLEVAEYYLIQETEQPGLTLVKPYMATEHALLICTYDDGYENTSWVKKTDPIFAIIEQLTPEMALEFEVLHAEEDDDMWVDEYEEEFEEAGNENQN